MVFRRCGIASLLWHSVATLISTNPCCAGSVVRLTRRRRSSRRCKTENTGSVIWKFPGESVMKLLRICRASSALRPRMNSSRGVRFGTPSPVSMTRRQRCRTSHGGRLNRRQYDDMPLDHVGWPDARVYRGHTPNTLDRPAKTVKAGVHGVPGGESVMLTDTQVRGTRSPDQPRYRHRYMTVREVARVMTFPDDWKLCGPRGKRCGSWETLFRFSWVRSSPRLSPVSWTRSRVESDRTFATCVEAASGSLTNCCRG